MDRCPNCGAVPAPEATYCARCGVRLSDLPGAASPAESPSTVPAWPQPPSSSSARPAALPWESPSQSRWEPGSASDLDSEERSLERERTETGITLLLVSLLLGWIPYIDFLGGILGLIGLYFLWRGRFGFTESHTRGVTVGIGLRVLAFVIVLVGVVWSTSAIVSAASVPGASLQSVGDGLQSALGTALVVSEVGSALAVLSEVALVYALSDPLNRLILWLAAGVQVALGVLIGSVLLAALTTAIAQATSGSTLDAAPLTDFQNQVTLWGLAYALPSVIMAVAYYRARRVAQDGGLPETTPQRARATL